MKFVVKPAAMALGMLGLIGPTFAAEHSDKEPRMVSPAETHMKGDVVKMESKMSKLLEERDGINMEIDALKKKMDTERGTVEKLEK